MFENKIAWKVNRNTRRDEKYLKFNNSIWLSDQLCKIIETFHSETHWREHVGS